MLSEIDTLSARHMDSTHTRLNEPHNLDATATSDQDRQSHRLKRIVRRPHTLTARILRKVDDINKGQGGGGTVPTPRHTIHHTDANDFRGDVSCRYS